MILLKERKWSGKIVLEPPKSNVCTFLFEEKCPPPRTPDGVKNVRNILIMSSGIIRLAELTGKLQGRISLTLLNTVDVDQLKYFSYDGHIRTFLTHPENQSTPTVLTISLKPYDEAALMLHVSCLCGCTQCQQKRDIKQTSTFVRVMPRSIDVTPKKGSSLGTLSGITSDLLVDLMALYLTVRQAVGFAASHRRLYALWHGGACMVIRKMRYPE